MANLQIIPANKEVQAQYVEMKVPLYSHGCENKVKKTLSHLRGIHSVHVDYELQKVTVWGICNKYDVLATIRKKRRQARFWEQSDHENKEDEIMEVVEYKPKFLRIRSSLLRIMSWKKIAWKKRLFPLVLS